MIEHSKNLRPVRLREYHNKHNDIATRVTMPELETGMFVEVYTTNETLRRQDTAVNFTARVEVLPDDTIEDEATRAAKAILGPLGIRLYMYSYDTLEVVPSASRKAVAYPELLFQETGVVEWSILKGWPFHVLDHGPARVQKLHHGFLSYYNDNQDFYSADMIPDQDNF